MNFYIKNFLIFVAGVLVTTATITGVQYVSGQLFPLPEGFDITQEKDLVRLLEIVPLGALLMVELSYAVGTFLGGFFMGWFSSKNQYVFPSALGLFFTGMNVLNIMTIPHPLWMSILTMVTFIPCAFAGYYVAQRTV